MKSKRLKLLNQEKKDLVEFMKACTSEFTKVETSDRKFACREFFSSWPKHGRVDSARGVNRRRRSLAQFTKKRGRESSRKPLRKP